MFGFVFGTACLAGLFYNLRRGGGRYGYGYGRRGGPGGWSWRGRMRWIFERLDTSPGQEKVMVEAADALSDALGKLRGEMGSARATLAQALRGETFDAAALREMDAKHDALLEELRKTLRASMAQVHEALDDRQRRELADLLEHGGRHAYRHRGEGGRCGGWRSARAC